MSRSATDTTIPEVSVVMSTHNDEAFLSIAIQSILAQTITHLEFIIVDDGSTDQTSSILKYYEGIDNRVHVYRRDCHGLTKSLNFALRKARGSYIARMDSDDVAYKNRFEKQLEFLNFRKNIVACGTQANYIDFKGRLLFRRNLPTKHEDIESCHLGTLGGFIIHPSSMIRRDALIKIGGYDESFAKAQDYDLWFRLGQIGRLANP